MEMNQRMTDNDERPNDERSRKRLAEAFEVAFFFGFAVGVGGGFGVDELLADGFAVVGVLGGGEDDAVAGIEAGGDLDAFDAAEADGDRSAGEVAAPDDPDAAG